MAWWSTARAADGRGIRTAHERDDACKLDLVKSKNILCVVVVMPASAVGLLLWIILGVEGVRGT